MRSAVVCAFAALAAAALAMPPLWAFSWESCAGRQQPAVDVTAVAVDQEGRNVTFSINGIMTGGYHSSPRNLTTSGSLG